MTHDPKRKPVTVIPPEREREFREWAKRNQIRDLDHPDSKYDYRGAFMGGIGSEVSKVDGLPHWPDTFKLPGHPTFSVESQYSTGPNDGGTWGGPDGESFTPGPGQGVSVGRPTIDSIFNDWSRELRARPDATRVAPRKVQR